MRHSSFLRKLLSGLLVATAVLAANQAAATSPLVVKGAVVACGLGQPDVCLFEAKVYGQVSDAVLVALGAEELERQVGPFYPYSFEVSKQGGMKVLTLMFRQALPPPPPPFGG